MSIISSHDQPGPSQTPSTQVSGFPVHSNGESCVACGPDAVLGLVTGLCEQAGVPCGDARPVVWVSSENEIILVPGSGLVARVTDLRHLARMRRELRVARFLDSVGIPAVQPAPEPPSPQLTSVGDRVITWWRYVEGDRPTLPQVAGAIARLHEVPVPRDLPVVRLDPTLALRRQARVTSTLPDLERAAFARYVADLTVRWEASLLAREPQVLLHGDPHQDNAIVDRDGRVLLLDFEDVALGPRLYDLRAPITRVRKGSLSPAELTEFLLAYGPVPDGEMDLVIDLKIAQMVGAYVALCQRYPHIVAQTRVRIRSLTDPSLFPQWWTEWHGRDE